MNIRASVVQGVQIGAKFGIATANLLLEELPNLAEGVYLVKVYWPLDPRTERHGLLHFGHRHTFGGDFSAEVHILDFSEDIYGQTIELELGRKLRDVQAFKNADALFTQIETDILVARKHFMRQQIWAQWAGLSMADREALAHTAVKHLSANAHFLEAQTIFAYAPQLDREISFVPELMKAFPQKTYAFPRVDAGTMSFHSVDNYSDLKPGTYGILEPETGVPFKPGPDSLVLVPSVALDEFNYRLGQGGGFYDRLLAELDSNIPSIAVVPNFGFKSEVPHEKHDQTVDEVVVCEL